MTTNQFTALKSKKATYGTATTFINKALAGGVQLEHIFASNFNSANSQQKVLQKFVNRTLTFIPIGKENSVKDWIVINQFDLRSDIGQQNLALVIEQCKGESKVPAYVNPKADGKEKVATRPRFDITANPGAYTGVLARSGNLVVS